MLEKQPEGTVYAKVLRHMSKLGLETTAKRKQVINQAEKSRHCPTGQGEEVEGTQ